MRCCLAMLLFISLLSAPFVAGADELADYIASGDRYFHAGEFTAAEREFATAAERFPDEPIPRLARGHTLFAMQDYVAASRSIQEGIHLKPDWSRTRVFLPGFFTDRGDFERAFHGLAEAVKADADDTDLLFLLAYSLHFSGAREEAQALFRRLLRLKPDHEAGLTFIREPEIIEL